MPHKPVLLNEVLKYLNPNPGEFFIDGTVGSGGHAIAILEKIMPRGKFLGLDLDSAAIRRTEKRIAKISGFQFLISKQIILLRGNYAEIPKIIKKEKLGKADGFLLDLGFSSEQIESSGRGFSFKRDEPLVMTYDSKTKPVSLILKELKEDELAEVISSFGEERFASRIARAIKRELAKGTIETSGRLAEIIRRAVPKSYERGRIDPATRTFQALRIYANKELENLEKVLRELPDILKKGGRVAIISFHSLEDRLVKENFRRLEKENKIRIITKKPVMASEEEVKINPRSRSAKLRAAVVQ